MLDTVLIFLVLLLGLFFLGIPVGFSLGITGIAAVIHQFGWSFPSDIIAQRMVSGINNFTILAVPFFLFAGRVMNNGGVTERLFNFADVAVGHIRGGLGHTNIMASMLFAGMSGAAVSDAAGLGTIEIKAMNDKGYDRDFSAAVTAASSTIGPIIPPSIPLVFYAVQGGVSVGALFMAGIIPGVLIGVTMMGLVYYYAARGKCPEPRPRPTMNELGRSFLRAFAPMFTPVIIIGGIYSGYFTPTEAAVVASIYSLFLSMAIYREIKLRDLASIIRLTVRDTVVMAFIVGCTYPYVWLMAASGLPQMFVTWMTDLSDSPLIILFVINIFLLIVGCFLEGVCAILILTPMLMPLVVRLHINPVHFGIVMVFNLMIGLLTPPFGMVLFVTARVANRPLKNLIIATMPFLIPLLISLLLVTVIPQITLFLPKVLGLM